MVYKKYEKRGGKVFGPYYYHSYRDKNGRVKKIYIGGEKEYKGYKENKKNNNKDKNKYRNLRKDYGKTRGGFDKRFFITMLLLGIVIIVLGLSFLEIYSNTKPISYLRGELNNLGIGIENLMGAQSTPGGISSCQVLNVSGIYFMTKNLENGEIGKNGCFNITTSNVELNCNGYYIRNTTLNTSGIYARNAIGLTNLTVRNCNITMGSAAGSNGIYFNNVNNSILINSTTNSNQYGIYLTSSSNNQIINNTANLNQYGIYIFSISNNNTITGNTANSNSQNGIFIASSSNNIITDNIVPSSTGTFGLNINSNSNNNQIRNFIANSIPNGFGLYVASNNNYLENITITSTKWPVFIGPAHNNTFINTNLWNCTGPPEACIWFFMVSQNNTFRGGMLNFSAYWTNLIHIDSMNCNNNVFRDMVLLNSGRNDTDISSISNSSIFFINVSYDSSKEYVRPGNVLVRKWYLDINVSDSIHSVSGANVEIWNQTGSLYFSSLTDSSGALRQELIEYINNGAVSGVNRTYYNKYLVNVTKSGYLGSSANLNLTGNSFLSMILLDITPPIVTLSSPVNDVNYSGATYNVGFVFDASDPGIGIANCSVIANGISYINTSAITYINNQINANLNNGNYSAYISCVDLAGNTADSHSINFSIIYTSTENNSSNSTSSSSTPDTGSSSNTGGGSGGSGGSGYQNSGSTGNWKTYNISDSQFITGYMQLLGKLDRIKIESVDNNQLVIVNNVSLSSAILNITSNIQEFSVGEERVFDTNNDGEYEITVRLNSILNGKAIVSVKKFVETHQENINDEREEGYSDEIAIAIEKSYNLFAIIFLIIIALICLDLAILLFLYLRKQIRQRKKEEKKEEVIQKLNKA